MISNSSWSLLSDCLYFHIHLPLYFLCCFKPLTSSSDLNFLPPPHSQEAILSVSSLGNINAPCFLSPIPYFCRFTVEEDFLSLYKTQSFTCALSPINLNLVHTSLYVITHPYLSFSITSSPWAVTLSVTSPLA